MTNSGKPYVLFVDDNEATCTLVTALLQRDFEVETVTEATEAIENLRTRQYAAILLDLHLPKVSGFAVLDFLQSHAPETLTRVLIVTASVRSADLERANGYGVHGVVTKPFEVETLLATVKRCARIGDGGKLHALGPVIFLLADLLRQRWPM
jgi:CheY-like chemotaxis protein